MIRFLTAACVVLAAVCVLEGIALRRLRADLISIDERAARAAMADLQGRRDEVVRVLTWMDASARSGAAPGEAALCEDGPADLRAIGKWLFDVYLHERAQGKSEIDARQRVLDAMKSPK